MSSLLAMIRMRLVVDTILGAMVLAYAVICFPQFSLTLFVVISAITGAAAVLVLALLVGHAIMQGIEQLRNQR